MWNRMLEKEMERDRKRRYLNHLWLRYLLLHFRHKMDCHCFGRNPSFSTISHPYHQNRAFYCESEKIVARKFRIFDKFLKKVVFLLQNLQYLDFWDISFPAATKIFALMKYESVCVWVSMRVIRRWYPQEKGVEFQLSLEKALAHAKVQLRAEVWGE